MTWPSDIDIGDEAGSACGAMSQRNSHTRPRIAGHRATALLPRSTEPIEHSLHPRETFTIAPRHTALSPDRRQTTPAAHTPNRNNRNRFNANNGADFRPLSP